jgi:hypothetical protein
MDTSPHATQVEALPSHRGRHALSPHDLQAPLGGMMDRRLPLGRATHELAAVAIARGQPLSRKIAIRKLLILRHIFRQTNNKQTAHPASRRTKLHLRQPNRFQFHTVMKVVMMPSSPCLPSQQTNGVLTK